MRGEAPAARTGGGVGSSCQRCSRRVLAAGRVGLALVCSLTLSPSTRAHLPQRLARSPQQQQQQQGSPAAYAAMQQCRRSSWAEHEGQRTQSTTAAAPPIHARLQMAASTRCRPPAHARPHRHRRHSGTPLTWHLPARQRSTAKPRGRECRVSPVVPPQTTRFCSVRSLLGHRQPYRLAS